MRKIIDRISMILLILGGLILGVIGISNLSFNPVQNSSFIALFYSIIGLGAVWMIISENKKSFSRKKNGT